MRLERILHTVDAHCEGEASRVVVGGVLAVPGETMFERKLFLERHRDDLRRQLLFEPRGQPALSAVLLMAPADPRADIGYLIMEGADYPPMSGTNTINAITVALETGIVAMREPVTELTADTPAGLVRVSARCEHGKCVAVSFDNVPCFVSELDAVVDVPGLGSVPMDVAYGGHFFALVPAAEYGLELVPECADRLAELGERIKRAASSQLTLRHPELPAANTLGFVTWIGPPTAGGHGRNATVVSPGRLDRSPCGTATCARLAVLAARGQIAHGEEYLHEGILSTIFRGEIVGSTRVGDLDAITPRITGRSWVYAVSQIGVDPSDPLPAGYTLSDTWGQGPTARF
ncbi:proline racemase family protein [Conexibacter sp. S30A1]|jgi:proline racemase|uniref:proline racemase family protein n=1 Tax=Conexibacter sp. S30A1 TaxID=2937800 RepID=UPI00200E5800|nr:proline racemase family protein [Conexibacter sp. S30A1]